MRYRTCDFGAAGEVPSRLERKNVSARAAAIPDRVYDDAPRAVGGPRRPWSLTCGLAKAGGISYLLRGYRHTRILVLIEATMQHSSGRGPRAGSSAWTTPASHRSIGLCHSRRVAHLHTLVSDTAPYAH